VVVGEDVLVLATLLAELLAALLAALLLLLAVTLELSVKALGAVLATDAVLDEGLERRRVTGFGAEKAVDGDDVNEGKTELATRGREGPHAALSLTLAGESGVKDLPFAKTFDGGARRLLVFVRVKTERRLLAHLTALHAAKALGLLVALEELFEPRVVALNAAALRAALLLIELLALLLLTVALLTATLLAVLLLAVALLTEGALGERRGERKERNGAEREGREDHCEG